MPGPSTAEIGGNTSCVEVQCGDTRVIFDAGTGLRLAGEAMAKEMPLTVHLFFSHVHWDHIQGFPFFTPAFVKGNSIHMYGASKVSGTVETALAGQMETPNFPVHLKELPASLVFHDLPTGAPVELPGGVVVRNDAGNHPGGVLAYRVEYGGKAIVYATDTEHDADLDPRLVELCKGADLLVFDTMYTPEEYRGEGGGMAKIGWGHSHFVAGVALVKAAGVKRYVLFHHDPSQSDAMVREKERRTRELFPNSIAAYEGLEIDV